jgi:hypothetical protein
MPMYWFSSGGMRRRLLLCAKTKNVCAYIEDYIDSHYSGWWAVVEKFGMASRSLELCFEVRPTQSGDPTLRLNHEM